MAQVHRSRAPAPIARDSPSSLRLVAASSESGLDPLVPPVFFIAPQLIGEEFRLWVGFTFLVEYLRILNFSGLKFRIGHIYT